MPLFFPTLTCGKGAGHKPDDCFEEAGEYSGKAVASSLSFAFPRASWCLLDKTRYVYHVNKFNYLVNIDYTPNAHRVREWEHACISGTWEERAWVSYLITYSQIRGRHSWQGIEQGRNPVLVLTASVVKSYVS